LGFVTFVLGLGVWVCLWLWVQGIGFRVLFWVLEFKDLIGFIQGFALCFNGLGLRGSKLRITG
jgi:hypothetical protein